MKNYLLLLRKFSTRIDKELIEKLERLSALKISGPQDIANLEEDIELATKIFEVDTTGVKPLYNAAEDYITCPLRDDTVETTPKDEVLSNAKKVYEGFFVSPTVGLISKKINKNIDSEKENI